MLSELLASLSQKDRTVALILALLIGISTVSGVTVYIFKLNQAKDEQVVEDLRKENVRLISVNIAQGAEHAKEIAKRDAEIARLNLDKITIQSEFLNDLKEQRDKSMETKSKMIRSVKKAETAIKKTETKINVLKDEITP